MNYAGFWQRFFAALLDGLIVGVFSFILMLLLNTITGRPGGGLETLIQILIGIGYAVVYQQRVGQTLGKKALGIKIVDASGKTPPLLTFFLREVVGKTVDMLTLGIGYLWMLWDPKKQALHDKIASTYVIKV